MYLYNKENKMKIADALNKIAEFNFNSNFKRILDGKKLDVTNKPYSVTYLDNMIIYFEEKEEYEKCSLILEFKNEMLNHDGKYYNSI